MNLWLRAKEAEALYGITNTNLAVTASFYKKKFGKYPKWRQGTKTDNSIMYNIGYFVEQHSNSVRLRKELTHPEGLFYTLTELYDLNTFQISKVLSIYTGRTHKTWNSWMSHNLWVIEDTDKIPLTTEDVKDTMLWEFATVGSRMLKALIKLEGTKSWEKYHAS